MARVLAAGQGAVSYTEAMQMTERERACLEIALGLANGAHFDYAKRRWKKPKRDS